MTLEDLLSDLRAEDPRRRMRAAYILGTVDEVAALDALYAQHRAETDEQAKEAIVWAGRRLRALKEAGYTTLDALIDHYRLAASPEDADSAEAKRVIDEYTLRNQMQTMESEAQAAAARTVMNFMLMPPILTMGRMLSGSFSDSDIETKVDALGHEGAGPIRGRTTPPRPTTNDIQKSLKLLKAAEDPQARIDIILDLAQTHNNPDALPYLAALHVRDSDERVQVAAQRAAKYLYWNVVYWAAEADGTLQAALTRWTAQAQPAQPPPPPGREEPAHQAAPEDIAEILRKAEAAREQRRRRG